MKAAVKKTEGKFAPGVNASSSPFCLSVQEMGTGQAVRCLSQSPWDWGSGEAWRKKGFIYADVTLSDIAVRRCAITSLPLQPPRALCKALPCTSELSDVAWQAEGSGTSAGLNSDLAKITLGTGAPIHPIQFLNQYWVGAEQWSRWNFKF